jgi:hypothetical protein
MSKRKKINPGKTNENQKTFESVAERKRRNGGNEQQILNKPFLFQFLFILLFLIVGFTIYSNTFMTPFVFDDLKIIKNNRSIRIEKLTAENIINSAVGVSSNRPISTLTFALNYYFDRYNLKGYHLVNIIIHITNAIILFFFIKLTFSVARRQQIPNTKYRSSAALWISFITAFIWLANPIQTQSVTYIVQRMNSMGASFFLLTLLFYAKGRIAQLNISFKSYGGNHYGNAKKRLSSYHVWFFASGVSGLLAFGSKESTAVLPFFILLYEWYFFQDLNKKSLKTYLKYIVPFIILLALIAFLYLGIDPGEKLKNLNDFKNEEFTVLQRVLTQPRVVIYYSPG